MPLSQIVSASIEDGAVAPVDLSSVAQYTGFKNRLINGGMVIDQRNGGGSVTNNSALNLYPVDRFIIYGNVSSKFTAQQNAGSVTPPNGFRNYLGCTSSSAYTVGASELFYVQQRVEGYNMADLGWGTANASAVTISFWVHSSLTGTFGGSIQNDDVNRSYPFTYTIAAANTWEQKSVTIAGDTSGTWRTTNGLGMRVYFGLGVGSTYSGTAGAWAGADYRGATGATSVVGTNGATFYITGVQIEKGVTATSFDYRPYGTELSLCQRYYEVLYIDSASIGVISNYYNGTTQYTFWQYQQTKRANTTVALASGSTWVGGTPILYGGTSRSTIGGITGFFYNTGTAGNPALTASAEL